MCIRDRPFTFIPEGQRSIALPDGSITSPFLEQFGRPSRDTGLESERSNRPTCLLYTSDAADERSSVDLGGRRIIKKKKK